MNRADWVRVVPDPTLAEREFATKVGKARYIFWKDSPSHYLPVDKELTEVQAAIGEIVYRRAAGQPIPSFRELVESGKGADVLHYNVKTYVAEHHVLFVHPETDAPQKFSHYLVMLWLDPEMYIAGELEKVSAHDIAFWNEAIPKPCWSVRFPRLDRYTGPLVALIHEPVPVLVAEVLPVMPIDANRQADIDRGYCRGCGTPGEGPWCQLCRWSPTYWRRDE